MGRRLLLECRPPPDDITQIYKKENQMTHIYKLLVKMIQIYKKAPSGRYPVRNVSYADPHVVVTDPFMWSCEDGERFHPTRPFNLDNSTHFKLSPQNEYMFFNSSEDNVFKAGDGGAGGGISLAGTWWGCSPVIFIGDDRGM